MVYLNVVARNASARSCAAAIAATRRAPSGGSSTSPACCPRATATKPDGAIAPNVLQHRLRQRLEDDHDVSFGER